MRTQAAYPHPRRLLALALAALAAAVAPATAHAAAGSAAVDSYGKLTYTAAPGASNHLVVTASGSTVQLADSGAGVTITPGSHCSGSGTTVSCSGVTNLKLLLGDGDNFVDSSTVAMVTSVTTGAGADHVATGAKPDWVATGGGADWIDPGPGSDAVNGGDGSDVIESHDGTLDGVTCGGGSDSGWADPHDAVSSDCEAVVKSDTPPVDPPADGPPSDPGDPPDQPPGQDPGTAPSGTPSGGTGTGTGTGSGTPSGSPADGGLDLAGPINLEPPIVPRQTASVSASGLARVQVVCPADAGRCRGTVDLFLLGAAKKPATKQRIAAKVVATRSSNGTRVGRSKFSAHAGAKPFVGIRMNRRGRRRVLRHRRTRGRVVVTTRSATGQVTKTTRTITLAPRRGIHRTKGRR